jgi:transposase
MTYRASARTRRNPSATSASSSSLHALSCSAHNRRACGSVSERPGSRPKSRFVDHTHEHPSQWSTIRSVAEKLGCTVEALRRWVRQAERDTGKRAGLRTSEREELKRLRRENFELKRANEILRTASAFFAQAELTLWINGRLPRRGD